MPSLKSAREQSMMDKEPDHAELAHNREDTSNADYITLQMVVDRDISCVRIGAFRPSRGGWRRYGAHRVARLIYDLW